MVMTFKCGCRASLGQPRMRAARTRRPEGEGDFLSVDKISFRNTSGLTKVPTSSADLSHWGVGGGRGAEAAGPPPATPALLGICLARFHPRKQPCGHVSSWHLLKCSQKQASPPVSAELPGAGSHVWLVGGLSEHPEDRPPELDTGGCSVRLPVCGPCKLTTAGPLGGRCFFTWTWGHSPACA